MIKFRCKKAIKMLMNKYIFIAINLKKEYFVIHRLDFRRVHFTVNIFENCSVFAWQCRARSSQKILGENKIPREKFFAAFQGENDCS